MIWNVADLGQILPLKGYFFHSNSILDIKAIESHSMQEVSFFITISTDNTIRFWNLPAEDQYDSATFRNLR